MSLNRREFNFTFYIQRLPKVVFKELNEGIKSRNRIEKLKGFDNKANYL